MTQLALLATRRSFRPRIALAGLFALLGACEPDLAIPKVNGVPVADARVQGMDGKNVSVDYSGSPVTVTLDATHSTDPDGKPLRYIWLSGERATPASGAAGSSAAGSGGAGSPAAGSGGTGGSGGSPAAGSGGAGGAAGAKAAGSGGAGGASFNPAPTADARAVPPGEPQDWPDDVATPVVKLPEGEYKFVLWVVDDIGQVSDPDVLTVTVAPPLDPAVKTCIGTVLPTVKHACAQCVCGVSDACRAAANQSMCDASCWNLIGCIGSMCPDFNPASNDFSCVTSKCGAYLSGSTGATAIGPCVTMCPSECQG